MNPDWDFLPVIENIYNDIGWKQDGRSVANKSDLIQRLNFSVRKYKGGRFVFTHSSGRDEDSPIFQT